MTKRKPMATATAPAAASAPPPHPYAQAAPVPKILESKTVATQFVQQYYHVLSTMPENLHRFYTDASTLSRSVVGGETTLAQTQRGIHEKVVGLGLHGAVPQILSVDAQTSLNGGVVVHATGFLTLKGAVSPRPFAQVFFLAQQEIGYYVLNDLFCWLQREEAAEAPEPVRVAEAVLPEPKEKTAPKKSGGGEAVPAAEAQPKPEPVVPAAAASKENGAPAPADDVPMTYAQRAAAAAKRVAAQVPQAKAVGEVLAPQNWGGEDEEKKPTIIKKKRERGKGRGRRERGDRGNKPNNA